MSLTKCQILAGSPVFAGLAAYFEGGIVEVCSKERQEDLLYLLQIKRHLPKRGLSKRKNKW